MEGQISPASELQELRDLCSDFLDGEDYLAALTKILQKAITITSADKGNLQILDPLSCTMSIKVHAGFSVQFLQFFEDLNHRTAGCQTASICLERVVVEDVRRSPLFMGTKVLQVLLEAGVEAMQSTPLITKDRYLVGMISTHYRIPTHPTKAQLRLMDELAEMAAEFIDLACL